VLSNLNLAVDRAFGEAQAQRTAMIQAHTKAAFHYLSLATTAITRWERVGRRLAVRRGEIERDPPTHNYHIGANEQLKTIVTSTGEALDERLLEAVGTELKWVIEHLADVVPREMKNKLLEEEAILLREASRARDLESGEMKSSQG
jgi:hypothetical protein